MIAYKTYNKYRLYFFLSKKENHIRSRDMSFFFQNGGSVSGWEIYYENIAMGNVFC